jgi:hypothetical protein
MNERIQLLAEQATSYNNSDGWLFDKEKFAELIVGECVGIVDKIVPPGYADYPDYRDQIEQSFRSECVAEIKKHFGVEE